MAFMPVLVELKRRPIVISELLLGFAGFVAAVGPPAAQNSSEPAASQRQPVPVIRAQTNLIVVRVVVRDAGRNPVSGLDRNDFKLFDNNKEQSISYFAPEGPEVANPAGAEGTATVANQPQNSATSARYLPPQRFRAIFFDDYHMEFGDLVQIREAAKHYLGKHLDAGERVAVVSASGSIPVGFTNDRRWMRSPPSSTSPPASTCTRCDFGKKAAITWTMSR
jgi:VWFA-related protein